MKAFAIVFTLSLFSATAFSQVKTSVSVVTKGGGGAAAASYAATGRAIAPSDTTKTRPRQTPNTSFGQRAYMAKEGNPLYQGGGMAGDNPLYKRD